MAAFGLAASADRNAWNGASWVIWVKNGPEAPKLRTATFPVFCLKSAAISFAGSVKFAATATLVWPACAAASDDTNAAIATTKTLSFNMVCTRDWVAPGACACRFAWSLSPPLYPVILVGGDPFAIFKMGNPMKISARNQLHGTIVEVHKGATTAHVVIDVGGAMLTASITNEAVDQLKLVKGQKAYAVIKASDVMVGID